jgi:protein involved in polysaccharide export with SLBB domain
MRKVLLIGIFSVLTLGPLHSATSQTSSGTPDTKIDKPYTAELTTAEPGATPRTHGDSASSKKSESPEDSALTEIYKIGVGDVLDIRLPSSPANRSTLYSVADGGLIDFPLAGGPISVTGLTVNEIQTRLKSELKRLAVAETAQLTVGVRQYASHTVVITGLVGNPGTKFLRREAVPLYVLLAEVQPRLDAGRVVVMRGGGTVKVLELNDSVNFNFIIRPNDVINLTARPPEFYYIAGNINFPGQKNFQPGITLVQAILAAGGLARYNLVELSREGANGLLTTTKIKVKDIKSGKIEDPKLQPGDRIAVLN